MPEGFSSIADLKIVADVETEKSSGGIELLRGLMSRFGTEAQASLSMFDRALQAGGEGVAAFRARLGPMILIAEQALSILGKLSERLDKAAASSLGEMDYLRLSTAINHAAETIAGSYAGALDRAKEAATAYFTSAEEAGEATEAFATKVQAAEGWLDTLVNVVEQVEHGFRRIAQAPKNWDIRGAEAEIARLNEAIAATQKLLQSQMAEGEPYFDRLLGRDSIGRLVEEIGELLAKLEAARELRERIFGDMVASFETETGTPEATKAIEALDREIRGMEQKAKTYGMLAADAAAYLAEMKALNALEDQNAALTAEGRAELDERISKVRSLAQVEADRREAEKAFRDAEREARQTQAIFAQMDREIQQIEARSNAITMGAAASAEAMARERALLAIRQQGREATVDELAAIDARAKSIAASTAEFETLRQQMEAVKETGAAVARSLEGAFRQWMQGAEMDSKKMVQALLSDLALLTLRRNVLEPLMGGTQGGLFGSLFGSLFGGAREEGGPVEAGKAYLVGEKRPELFMPTMPGHILPKVPSGGGITVSMPIHINAQGAYPESVAEIKRAIAEVETRVPGMAVAAVREATDRSAL